MAFGLAGTILMLPLLRASAFTAAGLFLVIATHRAKFNPAGMRVMDTLAGTSQALFGISGPIAMTRLLATFHDKNTVRHYAFAFFLAMNGLRATEYLLHGTYTGQILEMMAVSGRFWRSRSGSATRCTCTSMSESSGAWWRG